MATTKRKGAAKKKAAAKKRPPLKKRPAPKPKPKPARRPAAPAKRPAAKPAAAAKASAARPPAPKPAAPAKKAPAAAKRKADVRVRPAPPPPPGPLERLTKEFLDVWTKRNPMFAVRLGLHAHDAQMPDGSPEKELEDHRVLRRYVTKFQAIDPARLKPAQRIDRDLMIQVLNRKLFEAEELRYWESCPEAPAVLGAALFQLFVSDHAPLPERLRRIIDRMERMPAYITASRAKLTRPVKLWVDTELETIARLPSYFDTVKQSGRINLPVRDYERMCRAIDAVQNVMEDYANWIIIDVMPRCRKEFAPGREVFGRLLAARGIHASPEELLALGWRQFKWQEASLKRLGHKIKPGVDADEIREMIRAAHPNSFPDVLNTVRDLVKRAREIVARSGFATLPEGDDLRVMETPVHLRHRLPFGAYVPPARFDAKAVGLFFVTPGEVDRNRLKEHNFAALANLAVHEAYPGHHLQFTWANRNPSLARVFADAPETVEGWAHYGEEEMKRLGFDSSLKSKYAQVEGMLWRAARVVLDVRLATGKIGVDEASQFLVHSLGMESAAATAEVRRYAQTPGYALSYLYGKERIRELKEGCRRTLGRHFTEKFFHDALLASGGLPVNLLRQEMAWRTEEELKRPKEPPKPVEVKGGKHPSKGAAVNAKHAAAARPAPGAPAKPKPAPPAPAKAAAKPPAKPAAKKPAPAAKKKPAPAKGGGGMKFKPKPKSKPKRNSKSNSKSKRGGKAKPRPKAVRRAVRKGGKRRR